MRGVECGVVLVGTWRFGIEVKTNPRGYYATRPLSWSELLDLAFLATPSILSKLIFSTPEREDDAFASGLGLVFGMMMRK